MLPCAWQLQSMIFTTTQEPCQQALTRFPRKDSRSGEIAAYRPSWTVLGHLDRGPRVASLLQYQLAVMVREWEVVSETGRGAARGVGLGVGRGVGRGVGDALGVGVGLWDASSAASHTPAAWKSH